MFSPSAWCSRVPGPTQVMESYSDSHAVLVASSLFSALLFLHRKHCRTAVGLGVREEREDSLHTYFFCIKEEVESFYLG